MKRFKVPEIEVIYFTQNDIVTASCECDDCPECPEGSNTCPCVDPWTSDYKGVSDKVNIQGVIVLD